MEDLLQASSCGVHPSEVTVDLINNTVGKLGVKDITRFICCTTFQLDYLSAVAQ